MAKINVKKIQGYLSPEKMKDLDKFLDALPGNVGYNSLIFGLSTWVIAAGAVLFAVVATGDLTELRTKLLEVEALKPPVPEIGYTAVPKGKLQGIVDNIDGLYPGVKYIVGGNGEITLSAGNVGYIPQLKAAITHLQSGGKMWKTGLKNMCLGKECEGASLQATVSFERVRVNEAKIQENSKEE